MPVTGTTASRPRESWLAVHLPQLPLEALAPQPGAADRPIVVVDPEERTRTVIACNAVAARFGVAPGLGLNAVHALARDPDVHARDPAKERRMLERLAAEAGAFTPRVSLEIPDTLLLEVRGSLRLFGGVQALLARLEHWLEGQQITGLIALAPTPLAALWLARTSETSQPPVVKTAPELAARLASLPLTCLRWPERAFTELQSMGVTTVGDCLRLPRDGFARRFGPRLLGELDRALGRAPDVRRTYRPRERYAESRELEHEIEEIPRLICALEPLLTKLGAFLRERQSCVRGYEVQLLHRDCPRTRLVIRLVAPATDAAHFIELLTARLERITLPAPVHRVCVRSDALLPLEAALLAAAPPLAIAERDRKLDRRTMQLGIPRLVERLRARLGVEAVHGVCLVPEHRPESASRIAEPVPPSGRLRGARSVRSSMQPRDRRALRPLWLLSEPQLLTVEHGWPCHEGRLELLEGPERIESGWWDGHDIARDYYFARSPAGLRLWIYRERRSGHHWFLHGLFG